MDACPLCGGPLMDIRAKAVCARCGRIAEGCCEGAPGGVCAPAGVGRSPGDVTHDTDRGRDRR